MKRAGPFGGWVRCCVHAPLAYWTDLAPLPADLTAAHQLGIAPRAMPGYWLYLAPKGPNLRTITAPLPAWV